MRLLVQNNRQNLDTMFCTIKTRVRSLSDGFLVPWYAHILRVHPHMDLWWMNLTIDAWVNVC
jgi:hypothetical protein